MARKRPSAKRASAGHRTASHRRASLVPRKSIVVGFSTGAIIGACFGLASTILVMEISLSVFPRPMLVILVSSFLSAVLLIGGILGFAFSRRLTATRRRRR